MAWAMAWRTSLLSKGGTLLLVDMMISGDGGAGQHFEALVFREVGRQFGGLQPADDVDVAGLKRRGHGRSGSPMKR